MGLQTCLGLPDGQRGPRYRREQVAAPGDFDGHDVAGDIVFGNMLALCGPLGVQLRLQALVPYPTPCFRLCRPVALCALLQGGHGAVCRVIGVIGAIVGHGRRVRARLLGGREHGGRGDGPIRHGALSQLKAALGRAHSTVKDGVRGRRAACVESCDELR
jgi:hypothetical protein